MDHFSCWKRRITSNEWQTNDGYFLPKKDFTDVFFNDNVGKKVDGEAVQLVITSKGKEEDLKGFPGMYFEYICSLGTLQYLIIPNLLPSWKG